jgi:hypothetical protein
MCPQRNFLRRAVIQLPSLEMLLWSEVEWNALSPFLEERMDVVDGS